MPGIFDVLKKRSETPIEERKYGGIYLLLSGLLFVGTMWSVIDEVSTRRPWKEYQSEYLALSEEGWRNRLAEERTGVDSAALLDLFARRDSLESSMASEEVVNALAVVDRLDHELLDAERAVTFAKSKGDEAYYFWKKSVHEGAEDQSYRENTGRFSEDLRAATGVVDSLTALRRSIASVIDGIGAQQKEINRKISELLMPVQDAERRLDIASNSPIRILQVMMNGFDRSNFGIPKARIDRCQTCHSGWKDDMMEGAPQPFTKHPVPELLKFHDPELFGCTTCHRGQGAALVFVVANLFVDLLYAYLDPRIRYG